MAYGADEAEDPLATTFTAIGVALLLLLVIGLIMNGIIFHTYIKTSHLQTPTNLMIIGGSICDLTMLLIGFPFLIASAFNGHWSFGDAWCKGYGFVTTLVSVTNVCILTAIALDRYIIILEKPFATRVTNFKAGMTILSCSGYGLLWATFPLAGWGRFVVEKSRISCGPDWASNDSLPRTYNVTIFVLVFIVPLVIIIYCYIYILQMVWKRGSAVSSEHAASRLKQTKVAYSALLTIGAFVVAWLPYSVLSLWTMFDGTANISETVAILAPLFAKSSTVWNPMIYAIKNGEFRSAISSVMANSFTGHRRSRQHVQSIQMS